MRRIKLVVAYDGTNYRGWQLQPNGVTIEEELNKALSALLKEDIQVTGASRTDSGVHARGNVAVFDTESRIPGDKFSFALNQRLPEDIRVQSSEEVAPDYHPRKQNCVKTYEYRILNRNIEMPIGRLYSHFTHFRMDVDKMREAAAYLIGEHDFKSFCTVKTQAEETVRNVYSIDIDKNGDEIVIRISGSGFLYNMVRIIVGTLMNVGGGFYPPEHVEEILEACDRQMAGPTVPAKGLTLVGMEYEKEPAKHVAGTNKHYSYDLNQERMVSEGVSVLEIIRCEDEHLDGVIRRVAHQAYRNGASSVYVRDLESSRLKAGDIHGYYRLDEAEGKPDTYLASYIGK